MILIAEQKSVSAAASSLRPVTIVEIALFSALTATGGLVRIPVPPVPITLQTFFVYLSGNVLGYRKGAVSQLVFLVLGLMGLPVFTAGGGPGYIVHPTFGYLAGFVGGAWCAGWLAGKIKLKNHWLSLIMANGVGMGIILVLGAAYLYLSMRFFMGKTLSFARVMESGILVFLPGELIKAVLAAWTAQRLNRWKPHHEHAN